MLAVSGITRYVSEGSQQLPGLPHIPAVAHLASAGDFLKGVPIVQDKNSHTMRKENYK